MPSLIFAHRPYRAADLPALLALVSRRPPERLLAYPFWVDLQEITGTPEGAASLRLWEDSSGELAGFALLDGQFLAFDVSPAVDFEPLAAQILAWAAQTRGAGQMLSTGCREGDGQQREFFKAHGFTDQASHTIHFQRGLAGPIPAASLPDGFIIRPLRGEDEAGDWVALHRAALHSEWMKVEFRLAMMRAPGYRPDLDLVAVSPDGRLAAYGMGHFSEEENHLRGQRVGFTDPVATHPDFQGWGLARALLLACFRRLQACGMDFAEVSTSSDNAAMIRAAESVGYRPYDRTLFYDQVGQPGKK